MKLTRIERNQIYQAIAETDLDPAECVYNVISQWEVIRHEYGSSLQFELKRVGDNFDYILTSTIEDGHSLPVMHLPNVEKALPYIKDWANEVALINRTPDLWAEMQRRRELVVAVQRADSSNTPFTQDEQRQVAAQLRQITEQLKEQLELTSEQAQRVEEWRDETVEASTRMGRKDWFVYVLGTITALTITATVPAGFGEHILAMVIHGLGHLFTGGEPPRILT
jgi:hypothetical protein